MRRWLILAALALAALTTGSLGDGSPSSWDVAHEAGVDEVNVCGPVCPVPWTRHGPSAPATFVASGGTVTWDAIDNDYHTVTALDYCFDSTVEPGKDGATTFTIRDGAVYAYSAQDDHEERCTQAIALGDGAFVIEYRCLFHSLLQQGTIVVLPAPLEAV